MDPPDIWRGPEHTSADQREENQVTKDMPGHQRPQREVPLKRRPCQREQQITEQHAVPPLRESRECRCSYRATVLQRASLRWTPDRRRPSTRASDPRGTRSVRGSAARDESAEPRRTRPPAPASKRLPPTAAPSRARSASSRRAPPPRGGTGHRQASVLSRPPSPRTQTTEGRQRGKTVGSTPGRPRLAESDTVRRGRSGRWSFSAGERGR